MNRGKYECPVCGYFSFRREDVIKHLLDQDEDPKEVRLDKN